MQLSTTYTFTRVEISNIDGIFLKKLIKFTLTVPVHNIPLSKNPISSSVASFFSKAQVYMFFS